MDHGSDILLTLFSLFLAAQIGSEAAQRLRLPGVVGEITAGCIVGPSLLGWITPEQIASGTPLDMLSNIGVVLLLFSVGIETQLEDLKKVGLVAFLVGVFGVLMPFGMGSIWAHANGHDWDRSLFIAAAFVATSAGITARVLQDLGALERIESKVILGAAVIDDILAMLLLGVVVSVQGGKSVDMPHLTAVLACAIGFIALIGIGGARVMRRRSAWLDRGRAPHSVLSFVLVLCLGLAYLSTVFGLAAIIGAFLAGMVVSETKQKPALQRQVQPLLTLLTPFFFVITGSKIDLQQLASWQAGEALLVVTLIAVSSKVIGGFLGAMPLGMRSAATVGVGMIPRGEVGVVIASLGLTSGIVNNQTYAIIVTMSVLTSVITPPVLAWMLRRQIDAAGKRG